MDRVVGVGAGVGALVGVGDDVDVDVVDVAGEGVGDGVGRPVVGNGVGRGVGEGVGGAVRLDTIVATKFGMSKDSEIHILYNCATAGMPLYQCNVAASVLIDGHSTAV